MFLWKYFHSLNKPFSKLAKFIRKKNLPKLVHFFIFLEQKLPRYEQFGSKNYTYGKVLFWAAKATATSDTAFLVEV